MQYNLVTYCIFLGVFLMFFLVICCPASHDGCVPSFMVEILVKPAHKFQSNAFSPPTFLFFISRARLFYLLDRFLHLKQRVSQMNKVSPKSAAGWQIVQEHTHTHTYTSTLSFFFFQFSLTLSHPIGDLTKCTNTQKLPI